MKPAAPLIPLNYGNPEPFWRRRLQNLLGTAATLLLLVFLTHGFWQPWIEKGWRKSQELYWQRQCMNFQAPAGTLAVDLDYSSRLNLPMPLPLSGPYQIDCLNGFEKDWLLLRMGMTVGFAVFFESNLFVHGLTGRSGHRYLVIVSCSEDTITADLVEPAKWNRAPVELPSAASILITPMPTQRLRVYVGQIDPADPAYFTIAYESDGKKIVLDGLLDETTAAPRVILTTQSSAN